MADESEELGTLVDAVSEMLEFLKQGNTNIGRVTNDVVVARKDIEQIQQFCVKVEKVLFEGNSIEPMVLRVDRLVEAYKVMQQELLKAEREKVEAAAEKKAGFRELLKSKYGIIIAIIGLVATWGGILITWWVNRKP